ncbi:peptide-methionine (S)-S-oxide reductase MsrA [Crateriforma conspicua]|uniref:Peptide methionine sulfoxide reductase MsrA n=1 Tax=Crateriforma conspicua TaxID=2527996 RepID=A0A5C5XTW3_9PLAN|nr:peptide-methionine (S)-S-oxide reductase MsrA [Crateriforma conspicua]TWT65813.1 Peptide methionine sulfoxide reductase MsrA [Crateriforma conspicua]
MTFAPSIRSIGVALLVLLAAGGCDSYAQSSRSGSARVNQSQIKSDGNFTEVVTLAGGCFWCTEAVYEQFQQSGKVGEVVSGYIGGTKAEANYEAVCSYKRPIPGKPLHAEAVQVHYDPDKISFEEILEVFFKTHDPTSLYQQGADKGPQYRTSIFFNSDEQKAAAKAYIDKLNKEKVYRREVVTLLEDGTGKSETSTFYPAEEYHQDYFRRNPYQGYCQMVVSQKVRKTRNLFEDKLKLDP